MRGHQASHLEKIKLEPYVAPETADGLKYCFKTYTNTVRKHWWGFYNFAVGNDNSYYLYSAYHSASFVLRTIRTLSVLPTLK